MHDDIQNLLNNKNCKVPTISSKKNAKRAELRKIVRDLSRIFSVKVPKRPDSIGQAIDIINYITKNYKGVKKNYTQKQVLELQNKNESLARSLRKKKQIIESYKIIMQGMK